LMPAVSICEAIVAPAVAFIATGLDAPAPVLVLVLAAGALPAIVGRGATGAVIPVVAGEGIAAVAAGATTAGAVVAAVTAVAAGVAPLSPPHAARIAPPAVAATVARNRRRLMPLIIFLCIATPPHVDTMLASVILRGCRGSVNELCANA